MAKRQTFNIKDQTFQTKAEFKDFVKVILNKYEINKAIGKWQPGSTSH